MNAVEIEEAISALAERPFDAGEFPFAFLQAFGNKETTLKRLRKGESNKSDLGGVLQTNNIHIAVAAPGEVTKTLAALKASPATARAKAKFILATDGETFEAEDLASGETVACAYADFPEPLRLLPAARRHHHRQADPRKLLRHPGHQPAEPALCRAAEGQSRMGHGRAPPRHEPFHGAADLLLLRRGHRHLQRHRPVHRHDRADERAGLVQHP